MVRKAVINDPMVEVSFNDQRDSRKPVQPAQLSISRKNDITGSCFYILLLVTDPSDYNSSFNCCDLMHSAMLSLFRSSYSDIRPVVKVLQEHYSG